VITDIIGQALEPLSTKEVGMEAPQERFDKHADEAVTMTYLTYSTEDVRSGHPDLSDQEVLEVLSRVEDSLLEHVDDLAADHAEAVRYERDFKRTEVEGTVERIDVYTLRRYKSNEDGSTKKDEEEEVE
jgi:hypothetical protein